MRAVGTVLLLLFGAATASRAEAVYTETFDQGTGGWQVLTNDAAAGPLTTASDGAHQGAALVCRYTFRGGGGYGIGCTIGRKLTGARSFRLWLRGSHEVVLAINLREADESSYVRIVRCEPGAWRQLDLSLDRFRLSEDSDDENGQLDLNQIQFIGLVDVAGFMGQLMGADTEADAERTLELDDLLLDTDEAGDQYTADGHLPYLLDTFETGCSGWLPALGTVKHDPDAGALVWSYPGRQDPGRACVLLGFLGPLPKEGATHLLLTLKSKRAMTLVVVLQEAKRAPDQDESRYLTTVEVPASDVSATYAVAFDELHLDTDNQGSDEDGRLDLDQVSVVLLGDAAVFGGAAGGGNVLQLEEVELIGAG